MTTLSPEDALLDVAILLFSITFLTFDVALHPSDYLNECECHFLSEGFIEVSFFKSILECSHEHFQILRGDLDGSFIESGKVFKLIIVKDVYDLDSFLSHLRNNVYIWVSNIQGFSPLHGLNRSLLTLLIIYFLGVSGDSFLLASHIIQGA